jgi:hypothetical protein
MPKIGEALLELAVVPALGWPPSWFTAERAYAVWRTIAAQLAQDARVLKGANSGVKHKRLLAVLEE